MMNVCVTAVPSGDVPMNITETRLNSAIGNHYGVCEELRPGGHTASNHDGHARQFRASAVCGFPGGQPVARLLNPGFQASRR
jgi:hypothetical protein